MEAVDARPADVRMVKLLLARGADVNALPRQHVLEVTALQLARDPEIAKLLLKAGAKLDARNAEGQTALHFAAMHEAEEVLKLLLAVGAPVDTRDKHQATPLIAFCIREGPWTKNVQIPAILLSAGADINAKDEDGRTPWNSAHDANNKTLMDWLERHGAERGVTLSTAAPRLW
jgi:ankyrin repeat protein